MDRRASDNKYLHKDFHLSMNILLKYIYENFGKSQLIEYLEQYSRAFYKPVKEELKSGKIDVLKKYFTAIYEKEEWSVKIESGDDFIKIEQDACPAISFIKKAGEQPCPHYVETYKTVYKTLCENTPFEYILKDFDEETGACKQVFRKK